jgi:hypothetical protein
MSFGPEAAAGFPGPGTILDTSPLSRAVSATPLSETLQAAAGRIDLIPAPTVPT